MKKEKLGFFKKLFLVITDFRTYPFLVKHEKFLKSFLYLVTLTLIISIIFTTNIILKFSDALNNVVENYDEAVPEFELVNGILNIDNKYNEKINSDSFIVIDTDYTYEEYTKTKEYGSLVIYDTIILVNKDKIFIETPTSILNIPFNELEYEIDKESFYNLLTENYNILYYISFLSTLYISVFIGYFTAVLLKVLLLACLISVICFFTGVKLNFNNYIKIAIYAYTLPLIIELISFCLVGSVKDYAYYTTLFLTYIYIIYAIRAIRLDAFIMMFSRKNKGKCTPIEFENELNKYNDLVNNNEPKQEKDEETNDEKNNEDSK